MTEEFKQEFMAYVHGIYEARGRKCDKTIVREWWQVLCTYDNGTVGRAFLEIRESSDEWPNPGKAKVICDRIINEGRPKYSVDAMPTTRTFLPAPDKMPSKEIRRCECGGVAVNFGRIPLAICGACLWKLMREPLEYRITRGRELGIPVLDNGMVDLKEC